MMMPHPHIVFDADPRHGLVARSGWEQEEARTVLRDLGWEWQEEKHALVPPADTPDAGVQAVEQLHLHGYLAGYAAGPYGTMRLTLDRAEQVLTRAVARDASGLQPDATTQTAPAETARHRYAAGSQTATAVSPDTPSAPPI